MVRGNEASDAAMTFSAKRLRMHASIAGVGSVVRMGCSEGCLVVLARARADSTMSEEMVRCPGCKSFHVALVTHLWLMGS